MGKGYLPCNSINKPAGGTQLPPPPITPVTPVYSNYTSQLIGYGNVPFGVLCDAPKGDRNYGMNYHTIVYNQENNTYMAHRQIPFMNIR